MLTRNPCLLVDQLCCCSKLTVGIHFRNIFEVTTKGETKKKT